MLDAATNFNCESRLRQQCFYFWLWTFMWWYTLWSACYVTYHKFLASRSFTQGHHFLVLAERMAALLWPEPAYYNSFQRNKAQQCTERWVLGRTAWYKTDVPRSYAICAVEKTKQNQDNWPGECSIYSSCKTELLTLSCSPVSVSLSVLWYESNLSCHH